MFIILCVQCIYDLKKGKRKIVNDIYFINIEIDIKIIISIYSSHIKIYMTYC